MGAGASAAGGRAMSDEVFKKLDTAGAGELTLAQLDAAFKAAAAGELAADEQLAGIAQKKWSMFGDGWDVVADADEDDPAKVVKPGYFFEIMTKIYPHLAAPAAAAAEPEDAAATKLQSAQRAKQAKATVDAKRAEVAASSAGAAPPAAVPALPAPPAVAPTATQEAPAALGSARGFKLPAALGDAGARPSSAELVMERPQTAKKRKPLEKKPLILKKDAPETAPAAAAAPAAGTGAPPSAEGLPGSPMKDPVAHAAAVPSAAVADPAK